MKYADTLVTFSEVPNEMSLCINITGCPCHCAGCHSPYLAEDTGKLLDWGSLNALININTGITCVAFMGGDNDPRSVNELAYRVHRYNPNIKIAWYSGREELSPEIELENFDFIKLGPYKEECGPLNDPRTNQKFYKVVKTPLDSANSTEEGKYNLELINITSMFWRHP